MLEGAVRRLFHEDAPEVHRQLTAAAQTWGVLSTHHQQQGASSPSLCPSPRSPYSPSSPSPPPSSPSPQTVFSKHPSPADAVAMRSRLSAPPASVIARPWSAHPPCMPSQIKYSAPRDPDRLSQVSRAIVRYGTPKQDEDQQGALFVEKEPQQGLLSQEIQPGSTVGLSRHRRAADCPASSHHMYMRPVRVGSAHPVESSPVERRVQELHAQIQHSAQARALQRASRLSSAMDSADAALDAELASIAGKLRDKELELLRADEHLTAKHFQERDRRLEELQRSHEKAAALQRQQVEQLQRRAEAERREAEAAAAKAAEQAEEARRRQEQQQQQQQQQQQALAQQQQQQQQKEAQARMAQQQAGKAAAAAPGAKPSADKVDAATRCMCASPQALEQEQRLGKRLKELEEALKAITDNDSMKKQRRDIEKKMTVNVQQISATVEQVGRKVGDVYQLIALQQEPLWRSYAMYMFAIKVVNQWELIMLNNKAAFPLATVVVKVATRFPDLLDMTVALMHRECCFSVPLAFVAADPTTGATLTPGQQRRLMGFREQTPDASKPDIKVFESEDAFLQRVEGIMTLYGALVQVDEPQNPFGLDEGWRWLARFLNTLPASRASAKALISFLRPAGYSMHLRFRGQFIKALRTMHDDFLADLSRVQESDVQAVRTLCAHYLQNAQFRTQPEGRAMPKVDMSSYSRA